MKGRCRLGGVPRTSLRTTVVVIVLLGLGYLAVRLLSEPEASRAVRTGENLTGAKPDAETAAQAAAESEVGPESGPGAAGVSPTHGRVKVTGRVEDAAGTPLPGAQVHIVPLWPSGKVKVTRRPPVSGPDDRGRYRALLRPGLYAFVAQRGRLHSPRRELEVSGDVTVDLRVFPGPAELRVELVPAYAGVDPAAFRVWSPFAGDLKPAGPDPSVVLRDLHLGDRVRLVVKFEDGHYAYPANERQENHLDTKSQHYSVQMKQERQRYAVRIGRFATLHGRIVGPDGHGVRYAKVRALMDSAYMPTADLERDRSKPWPEGHGYFSLRVMPGRNLSLFVAPAETSAGLLGMRRPLKIAPLEAGETRELRIELEPLAGVLRGRFEAEGATTFDGLMVSASVRTGPRGHGYWRSAKVRPDGTFRLEGFTRGQVRLIAELAKGSPWAVPHSLRLKLEEGEDRDVGVLRLTQGGVLHGTARHAGSGRPYAPGFIHAVPLTAPGKRDWLAKRTVKTDASGRYRFERLAAGRYELHTGVSYKLLAGEHLVATVTVVDRSEQKLDLETLSCSADLR